MRNQPPGWKGVDEDLQMNINYPAAPSLLLSGLLRDRYRFTDAWWLRISKMAY